MKTEFEWINELTDLICSMSGWRENEAKTIVYWCIGTYGYQYVQKFPILVFMGRKNSGKTTALKMIMELAYKSPAYTDRKEMIITEGTSVPVCRNKLAKGGTHVMEEADGLRGVERFMKQAFDKFSGEMTVNVSGGQPGVWLQDKKQVSSALALHRRKGFDDETSSSRSIFLYTTRVNLKSPGKRNPDLKLLSESFLGKIESFAESITHIWQEIPTDDAGREWEVWTVVSHIANLTGDVGYIEYVERLGEEDIALNTEMELEEEEVAIFRTILKNVHKNNGTFAPRVAAGVIRKELKEDGIDTTSQNINRLATKMGFTVKNEGGTIYIKLHLREEMRKAQMQTIAREVQYSDEVLKD
ncbi:MAG: hypothetical protein CL739_07850 [Chloroflexi bacterium]|nr:hypothetical protein [Chloroflexota bacterium]